ncbi:M16 family metallopeptidase [Mucilaginibacter litoreus]|uniref:M16 family metallopeptidase n=1 Tax=Mucilaginibacter litoreus TaxID=1048221 RepID=A0ABW3ANC2_9SPHI
MNFKKLMIALPFLGWGIVTRAQSIPLDPTVRTGKLANGFTYFIRKNVEPQKRATLYLVVKAGSILEKDNQLGLAHFMEHMSFNGTKHFPKNELVEYLQRSGIRFGADLNAYTSFDETVYQLPIPTDNAELLKNGLQIMRDWAGEATLDPVEIDKERGVVIEEKRLRKGAGERLQAALYPFQTNNSRYSLRMPIGSEKVLTSFKKPDILSFYKDWYRPDLEAIIVVGDVDVAVIEKQVKALFSGMKNPAVSRPRTEYKASLLNRSRFLALTDRELSQVAVEIDYKTNSLPQGTKEQCRQNLLRNVCSQLLAGRLAELSKSPDAPVLNASGGYQPVIKGIDALSVEYTAKEGKVKEGFDFVYGALKQLKQFGFTGSEIERVKTAYLSQLEGLEREKDRQSSTDLADELKRHFLNKEPAPGIAYELGLVKQLLPGITAELIRKEIGSLISDKNRDVVITGPESKKAVLPTESTINSWIAALDQKSDLPYADKAASGGILSQAPVAGKVVSESKDESLGIITWKLSNGAKVVLKPTTYKNDEILFNAFSPGGTSLYSDKDFQSAANAAGLVAASGLGEHDYLSLPKLLTGKQVGVQPAIGERSEGFSGASSKADLKTAMELLYSFFTEPRKDSAVYNMIISHSSEAIAGRYSSPQAVFQDTVAGVLSNYNVRRTGPSLDKIRSISLDRAFEIYKERFADAGDFTFVFAGSFTPEEIRPLVEQYIASLPGGGVSEKARDPGIRMPSGNIRKTVYAGSEDKATVVMLYHGDFVFSPEETTRLSALKDVVQFRMVERLREQEGGAYAPSVSFAREHDSSDRYQITISFGCAPANVDKLIAAAKEEIQKIKTSGGVSADDLQKFKAEESRQLELSLQSNGYWLSYLTTKLQNGEDTHSILGQQQRIAGVGAAEIQAAAKQYLTEDLLEFVLVPKK